ncbi:NADH:flavin oxidoreductase [Sphingomonas koreensis]|uniref:NADH:flavin oxidoreductase n=2 Tax=Sphingomonas koreensis TaxID=93064 RepID=A0A430G1X6_9SPHN|nr:NADH:flavin oxidoreductase [Sphingomonas koreensis]
MTADLANSAPIAVPDVVITDTIELPCGAVLSNRLAKAAMTEGLADERNNVTEALLTLYKRWALNGVGLMLTGNIQVDRTHLERPGNIVVDEETDLAALRRLAAVGTDSGQHFWVQINHTGRQTPASVNPTPYAPSAISLPLAEANCGEAREMPEAEIEAVIARFANCARLCREAGFTGVQIHGAHGYLISQFLSPLANHRTDQWGGPLENRARFLLETVRAVRAAVGPDYPVSVKVNSADFQRGGFDEDESAQVVQWLDAEGIDLLEISGGNYEQMEMVGLGDGRTRDKAASTVAREAYFLDYARRVRPLFRNPLMITGGMRGVASMNAALTSGECDVVGIGRPLCVDPDSARALLSGESDRLPAVDATLAMHPDALGPDADAAMFKRIESFGLLGWYCIQLLRVGRGLEPDTDMSVFDALLAYKGNEEQAAAAWQRP